MITDGKHARVDGLTSLAVLPAVLGSWLNFPILDPIFGLLIGVAIVFITRDAVVAMWYRLMDAVDPHLLEHAESVIRKNSAVQDIKYLRMRWVGHCLHLESCIHVNPTLELPQFQLKKAEIERELRNELTYLSELTLSLETIW